MGTEYCVYCHECISNGKRYIGMTKDVSTRWGNNGSAYIRANSPNSAFAKAIQKYGWDGFVHTVLESGLTREQAVEREKYYIALYKTNICRYGSDFGYNLTDGGDGGPGCKPTEETRKKKSDNGKLNPPSKSCIALGNAAVRRAVICEETGDVFMSITDASNTYGISQTHLSACCRGRRKSGGGLHWKYADDTDINRFYENGNQHLTEEERNKIIQESRSAVDAALDYGRKTHSNKPVLCVETGIVYSSVTIAAKSVNTDVRNLSSCCTGKSKSCCGLHWQFANTADLPSVEYVVA